MQLRLNQLNQRYKRKNHQATLRILPSTDSLIASNIKSQTYKSFLNNMLKNLENPWRRRNDRNNRSVKTSTAVVWVRPELT